MSFTPFKFGQSQPASTGFGGFGQQNTSTTPAFGRPATGAFGQPATQQASPFGGGTFGAPANTAPAFGAPAQNTTTGFGGFGASQPTNTGFSFGANTNQAPAFGTAFGQSTQDVNSEDNPVTTVEPPQGKEGTSKAPQHPKNANKVKMWRDMRKDEKGSTTGEKLFFDNICALPQYWRISPEELRAQDYADGRKQAAPTGGLFGQPASTGFGQQPQQSTFGAPSTGAFGAPAASTGGLFGSTSNSTGAFGTTNTAFGAPKPAFGAQSTSQQPFSFGQNNASTTAPAFGTKTASTNPFGSTTSGGFGQTANKPFGGFGATNNTQPATTGFGASTSTPFGQPAQQTGFGAGSSAFGGTGSTGGAFSFGKPATTGAFGQPSTTDNKAPFSFGTNNATTQPAAGGFSFGQNNQAATPFGATSTNTGTSAFGQPQQQNTSLGGAFGGSGGGFSFGQNQQNKPAAGGFSFGNNTTNTAAQPAQPAPFSFGNNTQPAATNTGTTSTFGGFGLGAQNQQQQPQAQPALNFGGFGSQQTNNTAGTTGGGFGTGGGLFGGTTGGFGGFGASQTQGQQAAAPAAGGFSFGKPAATSTFGGGGGFNFGQSQAQNQQQPQQQQQSFLGQSQQLQPIQTSIDQNPYGQFGNTPVFANVQPAAANANAASTEVSTKKQPAMSVSYRRPTRASPAKLQLRGFANSTSSPSINGRFGNSYSSPVTPLVSSVRPSGIGASPSLTLDLSRGLVEGLTLSPQAFTSRPSVKKLVIEAKKPGESVSMFSRNRTALPVSNGPRGDSIKSIKPNLSATADASRAGSPAPRVSSIAMQNNRSRTGNGNGSSAQSSSQVTKSDKPLTADGREPKEEEWYSSPSLRDLKAMSLEDLSNVQDLKVGRKGMAEIAYTEPVDLTELPSLDYLFGESVSIGYVYKGQKRRIELGLVDVAETGQPYDGLERPAVVTVEQRFSKAKAGTSTDSNTKIINEKHEVKLRKEVEMNEHEFISWAPEIGKLVFKVQHFSLYTYDVDSSDEGSTSTISAEEDSTVNRKKVRSAQKKRRTRSDSPTSDSDSHVSSEEEELEDEADEAPPQATLDDSMTELDDHDSDRSYSDTPAPRQRSRGLDVGEQSDEEDRRRKRSVIVPTPRFAPTSRLRNLESPRKENRRNSLSRDNTPPQSSRAHSEAPSQQPIAQRLGLQAKKLAVMQASFFNGTKTDNAPVAANPTPSSHHERGLKQPSYRAITSPEHTKAQPDDIDLLPSYRPLRKWKQVPAWQSMTREQEDQLVDCGMTSFRDVRASFGQRGQICHSGHIARVASHETSTSLGRVIVSDLGYFEAALDPKLARKLLETQYKYTELALDDCELIQASCQSTLRFLHILSNFDAQDQSQEATLWRLGQVLFDEIDIRLPDDSSSHTVSVITEHRRRDALSAWLREAVKPAVESELRALSGPEGSSTHTARVFTLLTGSQIERACQVALSEGDIRLATLLSQAAGDEELREDLQTQLAVWRESRVDPQLVNGYRKIYELLSGNIDLSKGLHGNGSVDTSQDISMSANLDWKRAFGLRLWYGHSENSIHGSLQDYSAHIASKEGIAKPLPEYLVSREGRQWLLPDEMSVQDVLFELLTVFCDPTRPLDYTLSPRSLTTCPLDYRQSWHLYQVLAKSLRVRDLEDADIQGGSIKAEEMTVNYAGQLEAAGLWDWAAFVYLHLAHPHARVKAIKELLARHVQDFDDPITSFLTEKLKIPRSYIDEAVAIYGI